LTDLPTTIPEKQQASICESSSQVYVVKAGDNAGSLIGSSPENLQRVQLVLRVQVIGGLVKQVDLGRLRQDLRYCEPTSLTAGQRQNIPRG
jgi:hypothetical protein